MNTQGQHRAPSREERRALLDAYVAAAEEAWELVLAAGEHDLAAALAAVAALCDARGAPSSASRAASVATATARSLRIADGSGAGIRVATAAVTDAARRGRIARAVARTDATLGRVVEANAGLAARYARAFSRAPGVLGFDDLMQEASLGLQRAARGFDPGVGAQFSTYAVQWVRAAVVRALHDHGRAVRVPVHRGDALARVARARADLRMLRGDRGVTTDELASLTGELQEDLEAEAADPSVRREVSTDAPLRTDNDGRTLGDTLAAPSESADPERAVGRAERDARRGEAVADALASLTARESFVLRKRFGLDDDAERTLDEVGRELGCSRERIRQIQRDALAKLAQRFDRDAATRDALGLDAG